MFVLATIAVVSFAVSLYLEFNQLDFLQAHPIMVNLISGVVGFSSGFLTLSIGVNWFFERMWIDDHHQDVLNALTVLHQLESGKRLDSFATTKRGAVRYVMNKLQLQDDPKLSRLADKVPTEDDVLDDSIEEFLHAVAYHPRVRIASKYMNSSVPLVVGGAVALLIKAHHLHQERGKRPKFRDPPAWHRYDTSDVHPRHESTPEGS